MTVFPNYGSQLDTIIGMIYMYLGANNSTINRRRIMAIHVVNGVTFNLIHGTPYYITNDNTKQHIQTHVKIEPQNECTYRM